MDPTRLPSQQITQSFIASAELTFPAIKPEDITMVLPVKSSAPAMITRLKATPKDRPMMILVAGLPPSRPPSVKMSRIPKPI